MFKKRVVLLAVIGLAAVAAVSCNRELKPSKKGVFVVSRDQLFELTPVALDTEFTDEGFARTFFTTEPKVAVNGSKFYFILNGNYRPFELKKFSMIDNRYEEDTSAGNFDLVTKGMEGERDMFQARSMRSLLVGTYMLSVTQGDATLHYTFRAE
jgi:hypothetical protein